MKFRVVFGAAFLLLLNTCIDPYYPQLKSYESIMVVEGLISDENRAYTVKISRTIRDQNTIPQPVSDAVVTISEDGNIFHMQNCGQGIYNSDSLNFRGKPGKIYKLHIVTGGDEYQSDDCMMLPVPEIDSIYFGKDQELVNNNTQTEEGLRIFLDSRPGENNISYRWGFEETWEFKIPNPKRYDFIDDKTIVPVTDIKQTCWKSSISGEIIVHGSGSGQNSQIKKQPIWFIASSKSDRLMSEYSILVKQYSISQAEYEFWNNINKINESGDDIFASQPFPVVSNISNINDPSERVLGFFQVSAVTERRIFIPFSEIVRLHLPFYHSTECERIEKSPAEYSSTYGPPMTFQGLYDMFCVNSDYVFIEPFYNPESHTLEKLVFVKPECANCELTGFPEKPDYWIDTE